MIKANSTFYHNIPRIFPTGLYLPCNIAFGIFLYRGHFVPGGFCPRCLFDGWLMARGLLSGVFLQGGLDRIPPSIS